MIGWVSFLASLISTHLWWPMFIISGLNVLALNFMLSLMTYFKLFWVLVKVIWWLMKFVISCLKTIMTFMLRMNSLRKEN